MKRGMRKVRRGLLAKTLFLRSPARVAIIGFGEIALDHLTAYEDTGIARVVAISDVQPGALAVGLDRRPGLRAFLDYRRMLQEVKPDAVSICTWPDSHAAIVAAAAALGVKGILCEKPMALVLSEVEDMTAACRRAGARLACGHQYRFHPAFARAREILRSGQLGRPTLVRGHIKSTLANNGPHLIDTVRFLLGDPPALSAGCWCERTRGDVNRGYPAEDAARGEVLFEGGTRFEFCTGDLAPTFFSITVEGTQGSLEVAPTGLRAGGTWQPVGTSAEAACRVRQFREFIRWAQGRRAGYVADEETSARTVELVLALYEAARLGRAVRLPLANRGDVIRQFYPAEAIPDGPLAPAVPAVPVAAKPGERLAMHGGPRAMGKWFSSDPSIGLAELAGLARVIHSKELNSTSGNVVKALEREAAAAYHAPRAVASSSGTASIHVALGALNPNPGDEIITTPVTDMGSIIPILACNCLPVFADIDPLTGNLTAESIARRLTPRTKAVILVHLFGRPADVGPISRLLRERNVPLIEDCCQAHFAEYEGKKVGTFGDFGCFSLQQSKQITCGDGGITLVNRSDLADRAALFPDKGWDRKRGLRAHLFLGMNYRMTELQGAVARAQLRKLSALVRARREGANLLTELLGHVPGVLPPPAAAGLAPAWWNYAFRIDEERLGCGTAEFGQALRVEGVRVRHEYVPHPVFTYEVLRNHRTYGDSGYPYTAFGYSEPRLEDFPGLQEFNRRLLFISWSHRVKPGHVHGIAAAVRKVVTALSGVRHGAGRPLAAALDPARS